MSHPKYKAMGPLEIKMIEEAAEVLQALCKGIRFGWDKYNPEDPQHAGNEAQLEYEMNDLNEAYHEFKNRKRKEGEG